MGGGVGKQIRNFKGGGWRLLPGKEKLGKQTEPEPPITLVKIITHVPV